MENTQENYNIPAPRRRGRPPKSESIQSTSQPEVVSTNNDEVEQLKQQLQQVLEENQKLKQIAEKTISITTTKPLINCTDDEINTLYLNYIAQHETAHENALVVEADGKVIIPKSYYVVG
jgi:regulator of replication initiation timing